MAGRGFGGGRRGGRGRGRGQRPWARELPFEPFPEIEGLVPVKTSMDEVRKYSQFVNWSQNLQSFCETSPYYYEDSSRRHEKVQKVDIERYSDRKLQATKVKPPLWHFIKMDKDHMPEEIAKGAKHVAKKVRWDIDLSKLDRFEKLEQKLEGKEEEEKKEGEEEDEEEEENDEDDGEFSTDGDYEQGEDFDDDEDDFNMEEENDEPEY